MNKPPSGNILHVKLADIGIINQVPADAEKKSTNTEDLKKSFTSIAKVLQQLSTSTELSLLVNPSQSSQNGDGNQRQPFVQLLSNRNARAQSLNIDPQYLYYFLYYKKKQFEKNTKRDEHLTPSRLSGIMIPLPDLKQQKYLAEIIDKKVKAANILSHWIAIEISKIKTAVDEQLENHFASFEELVGGKNAKVIKLKDAGFIQAGKTPNGTIKQYFGTEFPFFNQASLNQKMDITGPVKHLSYKGLLQSRHVGGNSILVCFNGSHFGEAGILRQPGAINAQLIAITPYDFVLPEFLYLQVIAPAFQKQMKAHAVNQFIGKREFENLYVEVPSIKKQQKIMSELLCFLEVQNRKLLQHSNDLEKAETSRMELFMEVFENNAGNLQQTKTT
jgi:hypothetical protein